MWSYTFTSISSYSIFDILLLFILLHIFSQFTINATILYLLFICNQFAQDGYSKKLCVANIFLLFVTEAGELWERLGIEAIHVVFPLNNICPNLNAKCQSTVFLNLVFYPCTFPNYPIQKQFKYISVFPYTLSRF